MSRTRCNNADARYNDSIPWWKSKALKREGSGVSGGAVRLDASWTGDPSTARQKSKFKIPQPIQCPTCNLTPFPHLLFKMEWDTVYGNKHARPVLRCSIPAMQHAQSHASNRMRKWRLSMRTREPECAHLQTYIYVCINSRLA